jgi:Domain of unknown function (DUF4340)
MQDREMTPVKFNSTVALAGVAAVLGGLLANFDKLSGPSDEELNSPKLASYEADKISQIDIVTKAQTLKLCKVGSTWEVTAPFHARAASPEIEALGSALATLKASSVVTQHAPDPELAQYGLTKPAIRFVVHLTNSSETPTLDLGEHSPNGAGFYMRLAKSDTVYLGGTSLTTYTIKQAAEWRDKTPIAFDPEKADHFLVDGPNLHLEASKEKDSGWTFTRPSKRKGDASQIRHYLDAIKGAPIQTFADDIKADDPRAKARYTIKVWHDDSRDAHELTLGAEAPGKSGVYAVRGDKLQEVFIYPAASVQALHKDLADLADHSLYEFDVDKLSSATLELAGSKPVTAARSTKEATWSFETPVKRNDELGKLTALLYSIKQLKYERVVSKADEQALASASFTKPYAKIELKAGKEQAAISLLIGAQVKPGTSRYIKVNQAPQIYTAQVSFVDEWKSIIAALKQPAPGDKSSTKQAGKPDSSASSTPQESSGKSAGEPSPSESPAPNQP